MSSSKLMLIAAACGLSLSTVAVAGEITGTGEATPLQGNSICQFSGLNDNPDSTNPANPGGRTQSFGQNIAKRDANPRDPVFQPGVLCNGHNNPLRDGGETDE